MIYLDNAATTLQKPPAVYGAVMEAMRRCANPGRGGYPAAHLAEQTVFQTGSLAAAMFDCDVDRVCFTACATEGLNIAIRSLIRPGDRVVISGLEHNAVTRALHAVGAEIVPVHAPLFSAQGWLESFAEALKKPASAVVCLHVSNVFGAILPMDEISGICRERGVPLIVDASQSAGLLPVKLKKWQAAYIAMPGHKGLYGPQGTGLLLCGQMPEPLRFGGTGSLSASQSMPDFLPDRVEAGTMNVPGIAGLGAGLRYLQSRNLDAELRRQQSLIRFTATRLQELGVKSFFGQNQSGVLSFVIPGSDPEEACGFYGRHGVCLRAGLHCAPLAHQTAGTFPTGTLRLSLSSYTSKADLEQFLAWTGRLLRKKS